MVARGLRHIVGACVAALVTVVAGFAMLHAGARPAYAHSVPDESRTAVVEVTLRDGTTPVGGGSLVAYRVGEIVEDDGNYSFGPVYVLRAAGFVYDDIASPQLAADLYAYVKQQGSTGLLGASAAVGANGTARFEGLTLGLWLVVQTVPAAGYEAATPFLVSVPVYDKATGEYIYEVDASPKVSIEKTPTTPPPGPPSIPQTGQLNWPVPVLVIGGLVLIVAGLLLRRGRKDKREE